MKHKKIELPIFVCVWLDEYPVTVSSYPLEAVATLCNIRGYNHEVDEWLHANRCKQWKLINALQFSYEPEPEPRWGIKHKGAYLHNLIKTEKPSQLATYFNFDDDIFSAYTGSRKIVEEQRDYLGFGEVIDLNKEGKADD